MIATITIKGDLHWDACIVAADSRFQKQEEHQFEMMEKPFGKNCRD